VLLGVSAASIVEVPYYAIAPGRPVSTAPLVSITDGPSFDPDGAIFLTTVSLQRTSALGAVLGWLDPTVDVVKEDVVLPPGTPPSRLRATNLEAMDGSKQAALGVAYEALGFDAIRGTGAIVDTVVDGTPAAGSLVSGETIVAVGDREVGLSFEVGEALEALAPGDEVALRVEGADGEARDERVVLGANPDAPDRPFLGVLLQTRDFALDFPYDVTIDSDEIGGPSAGLAFTLEVLDRLTEGDLTGGEDVAATGEIGWTAASARSVVRRRRGWPWRTLGSGSSSCHGPTSNRPDGRSRVPSGWRPSTPSRTPCGSSRTQEGIRSSVSRTTRSLRSAPPLREVEVR
jgi:PDZ domain-containing protein